MAQEPRIEKKASVLKTEISLEFIDTGGVPHKAKIIRDVMDPDHFKVSVDDKTLTEENGRAFEEFLFCEQDENGDVTIGKKKYFCHVLKTASEGAFLLGNHSCPVFLNPPGVVVDL